MKRNRYIFLLACCLGASKVFAGGVEGIFDPRTKVLLDAFGDMVKDAEQQWERNRIRKAEEKERTKREIEEKMEQARINGNQALVDHYTKELGAEAEAKRKFEERADRLGEGLANLGQEAVRTGLGMIRDEAQAKQNIQKAAVEAHAKGKADIEKNKLLLAKLSEPNTLRTWGLALTGTAFGIFGSWHALKFGFKMLEHMYRNPTLAQETSLIPLSDRVYNFVMGVKPEVSKVSDVILEAKLAARVATLAESVTNTVKNNAYFRHILFYGPPGTGKTMLAQRIARTAGLEYVYFAASSLDQFSIEEAMIKITELFEYAKKSSKKLMLIIDEAEMLFANREKGLSEKARKMLTHILTFTGTETRDFVIVALTNRPQDLDAAFISRCDERILIDAPAADQRRQILDMYVKKFLVNSSIIQKPTGSFIKRMISSGPKIKTLTIKPEVLDPAYLDAVNAKLEGFVGRDISKLIIGIQSTAYTTKDATVTKEMFDMLVDQKIQQKKQEDEGFKVAGRKS